MVDYNTEIEATVLPLFFSLHDSLSNRPVSTWCVFILITQGQFNVGKMKNWSKIYVS